MILSLEALFQRLRGHGTDVVHQTPAPPEGRQPTSIRLDPRTRHFLEAQADALNISLQSMIGMILDEVAEPTRNDQRAKLRRLLTPWSMSLPVDRQSTLLTRFFHVMDTHGLSLPDVVELLSGFGFTRSALRDPTRLVPLLTPLALQYIAEVFDTRLEWLAAGTGRATRARHWSSDDLRRQLTADHAAGRKPSVTLVRAPEEVNARGLDRGSLLFAVVRRENRIPSGTWFVTFQVWRTDRWREFDSRQESDASRAEIEAMASICERTQTELVGIELPCEALGALSLGRVLPTEVLGCLVPRRWHPTAQISRGCA
jgi:hypothetical protein